MVDLLANYVLQLGSAAESTHEANDRPVYRILLAEAAILLASAVKGASAKELVSLLQQHERTRGNTWIRGPEHAVIENAWEAVIAQAPDVRAT
jgi:hypothetical protein